MEPMEPMDGSAKVPKSRTKSAERPKREYKMRANVLEGGIAVGLTPMNAADLVAAWNVPSSQVDQLSVIVLRQVIGSKRQDVLTRVALRNFDMVPIIRECGPGTYVIKGAAGPFERKCNVVNISEYLANQSGYGRMPAPPAAADVVAVRTLAQTAGAAGIQGDELVSAIERASERATLNVLERYGIRPGMPVATPIQNPAGQLESMETMLGFMDRLETRAMDMAERRLGIKQPDEKEDGGGLMGTINTLGSLMLEFMKNRTPAPAAVPTFTRPAAIPEAAPVQAQVENPILNMLTEEEKPLVPILRGLAPYVGALGKLVLKDGMSEYDKALEMASFIPDVYAAAFIQLGDVVRKHGPHVLSLIRPECATPAWASVVMELQKVLKEKYEGGPDD